MADKTPNLGLVKPLLTEKYDVGIFNGNADIVDAALAKEITRAKEAEAINRSSIGLQKKNILKQGVWLTPDFCEEKNGITLTANEDKSISLNGTAIGDGMNELAAFLITEGSAINPNSAKKGSYILSGCPSDGANSGTLILLAFKKTTGEVIMVVSDEGNSATFSIEEDFYYRVFVCYKEGTVFDNVTYYPMLRSADISDSTYEKYTPSLQEQIETLEYEAGKDADDLANYILANEDAHYDLGLRVTAAEEAITALGTDVSGKLNRFRKWMDGSISVDIGSATLIEISGVSTVGIAHRHYLKLVRIGNETAVLEESKGAGTGVSYTYTIEDNILTVTNTGSYGHNITVIY